MRVALALRGCLGLDTAVPGSPEAVSCLMFPPVAESSLGSREPPCKGAIGFLGWYWRVLVHYLLELLGPWRCSCHQLAPRRRRRRGPARGRAHRGLHPHLIVVLVGVPITNEGQSPLGERFPYNYVPWLSSPLYTQPVCSEGAPDRLSARSL